MMACEVRTCLSCIQIFFRDTNRREPETCAHLHPGSLEHLEYQVVSAAPQAPDRHQLGGPHCPWHANLPWVVSFQIGSLMGSVGQDSSDRLARDVTFVLRPKPRGFSSHYLHHVKIGKAPTWPPFPPNRLSLTTKLGISKSFVIDSRLSKWDYTECKMHVVVSNSLSLYWIKPEELAQWDNRETSAFSNNGRLHIIIAGECRTCKAGDN